MRLTIRKKTGGAMDKLIRGFNFVKARLNEPSTLASLAAVSVLLGLKFDSGMVQDFLNVGTLIFGTLGFFVKETKP